MRDEFTDRELNEQGWGNAVAMLAATHEFLKQRGIDPVELFTFFGQTHAEGWGEARGDLKKIAYYLALNMATFGFSTETIHEDGKVTVRASWSEEHDDPDWPIPVKPALTDMGTSFEPIMSWLGVAYSWQPTEDGLVFSLALDVDQPEPGGALLP